MTVFNRMYIFMAQKRDERTRAAARPLHAFPYIQLPGLVRTQRGHGSSPLEIEPPSRHGSERNRTAFAKAARTHGLMVADVGDWREKCLLGAENAP